MAKKSPKSTKKRKPKGKSVSELVAEKRARSQVSEQSADEGDDALPGEFAEDAEPPPTTDDDDEGPPPSEEEAPPSEADDEDWDDDDDDDEDDEDDDPSPAAADEDDDESDEDDDEHAAGHLGHRRYVMAGFFGLWLVVGYICGKAATLAWSMFAAKDWFVENLPVLAAVPHDGDLISRESLGFLVGAGIGGLIVLRYYVKPSIRTWADEVAEQLVLLLDQAHAAAP